MSVYRDTDNGTVAFQHPIGTPLNASIKDASGTVLWSSDPANPIVPTPGFVTKTGIAQYSLTIPWTVTQYNATLTIEWSDGNGFVRDQEFDVVTPIVDFGRLMTIYPDQNPALGDLQALEDTIRSVIEVYCGQVFGNWNETEQYIGNGTGKLVFSKRCNKVNGVLGGYAMYPSDWVAPDGSVNTIGQLNLDTIGLIQDGWAAVFNWPEYLDVRQSPPMELIQFAPAQDGTIRVPRTVYREYDKGTQYQINADWGWDNVPEDVQQAALLLANDYITGDSGYRDRYLQILKIQQDSFTYHTGAFRGTGNARADLLLGPYRRQNGMVIL